MEKSNNRSDRRSNQPVKGRSSQRRRNRGPVLRQSEVISRKGRRVGSDDMQTLANMLKFGEYSGLHGQTLMQAGSVSKAAEAAIFLALRGDHRGAARKAASTLYVLKRNERIGKMEIVCRDGRKRKIRQMLEWFSGVQNRIADDVAAQQEAEAAASSAANVKVVEVVEVVKAAEQEVLAA